MFPKKTDTKTSANFLSAKALDTNYIQLVFDKNNLRVRRQDISLAVDASIKHVGIVDSTIELHTTELDYRRNYFVTVKGLGSLPVDMGVLLDKLHTDKPLGFTVEDNHTVFRLFAPRADQAKLILFEKYTDSSGREFKMQAVGEGIWECELEGTFWNQYYGYKVSGPNGPTELFHPDQVLADPYSKAVCTRNTYHHEAKSIIVKTDEFNWDGDTFLDISWNDLITYEMHVRDMTVHPSAKVEKKGTYLGLIEAAALGGLSHLKELGVNAVELLPCHEFSNLEIPYNERVNGTINTWNPYARNHWGYMTSFFFAPESYYATGGTLQDNEYCGVHGQQVNEFKEMVKAFHQEGIAVIMDVVFNHVSHYDWNPLKYTDKKYYFRLDPQMNFLSLSGCGNDLKTERPMTRRLIVDSVKYWLEEYHVDGFRFDLAAMLDWETIEHITEEAKKINPHVILIAEPWGGGKYDLGGFSKRQWAAWNDLYRNGVKGQNPENGLGWIFGRAWSQDSLDSIRFYLQGCVKEFGGPFVTPDHSVNYLESHDGHTLGDFIRIGSGEVDPHKVITDLLRNAKLSDNQMRINKLAALFLLISQGQVMISEGQEFARSKVIAPTTAPDADVGLLDHNSYNKDNETNWLDFEHKELNRELFEYYRGLIELRKKYAAFRRVPLNAIKFLPDSTQFSLGFVLPNNPSSQNKRFVVLLNSSPKPARFVLPSGRWCKLVDGARARVVPFDAPLEKAATVPRQSGLVLIEV